MGKLSQRSRKRAGSGKAKKLSEMTKVSWSSNDDGDGDNGNDNRDDDGENRDDNDDNRDDDDEKSDFVSVLHGGEVP